MMDIYEIRLRNVRRVIAELFGGNTARAAREAKIERTQFYRWAAKNADPKNRRNIEYDSARKLEEAWGLKKLSLDDAEGASVASNVLDVRSAIFELVDSLDEEEKGLANRMLRSVFRPIENDKN